MTLEQATTLQALLEATRRASRGHRADPLVAAFVMDAERHCLRLQRALRLPLTHQESWHPTSARTFRIFDPKPRLITVSPFADRVVHHALIAAAEPALERYAISDSYSDKRRGLRRRSGQRAPSSGLCTAASLVVRP